VEVFGYAAFILALVLGVLDVEFAVAFFLAAVGFGALLSVAAVFLEELRLRRYPRWADVMKLTLYGVVENFGYRQLNTLWRVGGVISFLRKNAEWGDMERGGFKRGEQGAAKEEPRGPGH